MSLEGGPPVSLVDVFPTLLDLCGVRRDRGLKEQLEGHSVLPLLRDESATRERPALITWGPGNHALRIERWRLIRYADGSEELYDHRSDTSERVNLAGTPEIEGEMERLRAWLPAEQAPPAPLTTDDD